MRTHSLLNAALTVVLTLSTTGVFAHCDTLDGPVVQAARAALESGDVAPVLIWVGEADEQKVRGAFRETLDVRALGPAARDLADTYFFETVVRLHRQAEGASYSGLKPAGTDRGPAISAADSALESGSADDLVALLSNVVENGVHEHFAEVSSKKAFDPADIEAGRRYVSSYVEYTHYIERIYESVTAPVRDHYPQHE